MDDLEDAACPACGNFIDYCPGHGEIGDPDGHRIIAAHEDDDHTDCNPLGCIYVRDPSWDDPA